MTRRTFTGLFRALLALSIHGGAEEHTMTDIYAIDVQTIDGRAATLEPYRGRVMLIVNVASRCGYTPQYEGLEALYEKYRARGLVVLGFPCNQFGSQEPGTEKEIMTFCQSNFGVTFPMFAKIDVNGDDAHPLYRYLKKAQPGVLGSEAIKWNFTKFLVDRGGNVVERFAPSTIPKALESAIEKLLEKP